MVPIIYEDTDIIVVQKPAGLESQSVRGFAQDMVSELRRYFHCPQDIHSGSEGKDSGYPPYVGVIHRLDKPVNGIMVYAKNQKAAAVLSASLQAGKMKKFYQAVVCGKLVDKQGTYVDYLRNNRKNNTSEIVDKSAEGGRKAVLNYYVKEVIHRAEDGEKEYSLIDIELLTGRHHQIRVQFAAHGTPLYGDERYGGKISTVSTSGEKREDKKGQTPRRSVRPSLALCACKLSFPHPSTNKLMAFEIRPTGGAFDWFKA